MRPPAPDGRDRARGALLGLAIGDALGSPVEGHRRGSFAPLLDFAGTGWTDDTSMALCLAESLLSRQGFDPHDLMARFLRWFTGGENRDPGGRVGIGLGTRMALLLYESSGDPYAGQRNLDKAGNGSIMRLAPAAVFAGADALSARALARLQSHVTHAAPQSELACEVLVDALAARIHGTRPPARLRLWTETTPDADRLAPGAWRPLAYADLRPTGYAIDTLEAALWCDRKGRSFEEAVLLAANLGGDADTVAAVTGQLAGARWGAEAIPAAWRAQLHDTDRLVELADQLWDLALEPGQEIFSSTAAPGEPTPLEREAGSLSAFSRSEGRVCPEPQAWDALWTLLRHGAAADWPALAQLSPPMILGGWSSPDAAKRGRLAEHIAWAAAHGRLGLASAFLRGLPDDQWRYEPGTPGRGPW